MTKATAGIRTGMLSVAVVSATSVSVAQTSLPDPTRPPDVSSPARSEPERHRRVELRLDAVITGERRRVAIIDGRPLTEGARIGKYRVVTIGDGAVTLRGPNGMRTLSLVTRVKTQQASTAERVRNER